MIGWMGNRTNRLRRLWFILVLVLQVLNPARASAETRDQLFFRVDRMPSEQKKKEARKLLHEFLLKHPNEPNAHVRHGYLDNEYGDYASALDHMNKAIALTDRAGTGLLFPQQVFIVRAFANFNLNKTNAAYADINHAIKMSNSTNAEAFYIRGIINRKYGKTKAALADFERGATLAPSHESCVRAAADMAGNLKLYRKQQEWLDKLVSKFPTAENLWARSQFHAVHGDMRQAIADIRRCIELDPADKKSYIFACDALNSMSDFRKSAAVAKQGIERFPDDFELRKREADSLLRLGDFSTAHKLFKRLVKTHPDDPFVRERYAMVLRKEGRYEESYAEFKKAKTLREPDFDVLINSAQAARFAEQYRDAAMDYTRAYQITSDRTLIVDAALCWLSTGDYKKALATLDIALDPKAAGKVLDSKKLVQLHTIQSQCFFHLTQFEKSRVAATQAIALDKDSFMAYVYRAQANGGLKLIDEAIVDLTQAIRLRPDFAVPYRERARLYEMKNKPDLAQKDRNKLKALSSSLEKDVFPSLKK